MPELKPDAGIDRDSEPGGHDPREPEGATEEREMAIAHIIGEYVDRLTAGQAPAKGDYYALHPQYRADLAEAFEALDVLEPASDEEAASNAQGNRQTIGEEAKIPYRLGDFEIRREIGRGGMGIVYEAEQISLKRRVALKVLPLYLVRDERQVRRFQIEAEATAKLQHSNIVRGGVRGARKARAGNRRVRARGCRRSEKRGCSFSARGHVPRRRAN